MRFAKKFLLFTFVLSVFSCCAYAQQTRVFNERQALALSCSQERLFAVYTFLDPNISTEKKTYVPSFCSTAAEPEPIPMTNWLRAELPNMESRILWKRPNEETGVEEYLNEAEMWRGAIARIYDFLSLAEQINDGTNFSSLEIMEQFGNIRTRYLIELDRLNTNPELINYNLRDSMEGRGRSMLATLELINSEMDSVAESFVAEPKQWRAKFRKSVIGIIVLSNSLYGDMMTRHAPVQPQDYPEPEDNQMMIFGLMFIGMVLIFFAVWKLVSDKNDEINTAIAQYMQKSAIWADDYSRQFLDINVKYIVLITLALFSVIGLLFGFMAGGFLGFIMFAACFGFGLMIGLKMPGMLLGILKKRRGDKINNQLMDALILLSNSLKSGMDIVQGFDMVSRDLMPPIADEFGLVIKNYKLGTPFEQALEGMEERVESRLLSYMVKAIVLQRQVGGNLTKIFERIVENIREESKLEEKLQAMTAQNRIQAVVVGIMPWVMVGVMFVFQPDTMIAFYTKPIGLIILFICIVWIGIGIKLVNKLGEIKV